MMNIIRQVDTETIKAIWVMSLIDAVGVTSENEISSAIIS